MMKHNGFTLAEVLAVIAIVGFIAMSLITVMNESYEKKGYDIGVQKMISRLTQAIKVNKVTHEFESWDDIFRTNDNIQKNFFNQRFKVVKTDNGNTIAENFPDGKYFNLSSGDGNVYTLKDGIQYSIFPNENDMLKIENEPVKVILTVDMNGMINRPNAPGKDIRMIVISENRVAELTERGDIAVNSGVSSPECGKNCVLTSVGELNIKNGGNNATYKKDAYKECSKQNMILPSSEEMIAVFSSAEARKKAGISSSKTSCYNVRDSYLSESSNSFYDQYVCYNPSTGESLIIADTSLYDSQNKTLSDVNNPVVVNKGIVGTNADFNSFRNNNSYDDNIKAICVNTASSTQIRKQYPAAEMQVGNKAYKVGIGCFNNDSSRNGVEGCSLWDSAEGQATVAQADEFCKYYNMRLPSWNEIYNDIAPDIDSGIVKTANMVSGEDENIWITSTAEDDYVRGFEYNCNPLTGCNLNYSQKWISDNQKAPFFCVGDLN